MKNLPRMIDWIIIALLLTVIIYLIAPQQLPVSLYKINLIAVAGVVGYWLDRSLFPYARPDSFLYKTEGDDLDIDGGALNFDLEIPVQNNLLFATSMVRRALIVAAAMIAVGLGA